MQKRSPYLELYYRKKTRATSKLSQGILTKVTKTKPVKVRTKIGISISETAELAPKSYLKMMSENSFVLYRFEHLK